MSTSPYRLPCGNIFWRVWQDTRSMCPLLPIVYLVKISSDLNDKTLEACVHFSLSSTLWKYLLTWMTRHQKHVSTSPYRLPCGNIFWRVWQDTRSMCPLLPIVYLVEISSDLYDKTPEDCVHFSLSSTLWKYLLTCMTRHQKNVSTSPYRLPCENIFWLIWQDIRSMCPFLLFV